MTATMGRADSSASATGYRTVATRAHEWSVLTPDVVAMREKDFGIWQEITWAAFWESIELAAHALLDLGVQPGDRVSIHSEDRPEWLMLDLATVAVRGVTVGFYPTNPTAEVEYMLTDCGARVHFAEDQEQVDKLFEMNNAPDLEAIIYVEPRGVVHYKNEALVFWDDFLERGRQHREANPGAVAARMAEATADDLMTLVYTSGTTGPPKGAMISNTNAEYAIQKIVDSADRIADGIPPGPQDEILSYLPLCHIAERIFTTWTVVGAGVVSNFAESIETVQTNLREIQPTVFFAVPRIWEKLHAGILIKGMDATPIKKLLLKGGLKAAESIAKERLENGGEHTSKSRMLDAIWTPLVFRALKDRIGLRRVRYCSSGAAAIAPEVLEFFLGIGVPIYELYGMTENAAIATANFRGRMKLGTVGEPYPDIGLRLDEGTGEIQTKHAGVFVGYWNKPQKTEEAFTEDGWLRTGDVGEWVDGTHIKIVDRIKDIIITSGGKNISPSEIENTLKTSPYIKEAMVIGDGRKFLGALIGMELDTVGDWATRKGLAYTTYRDLSEKPEVLELMQNEVNKTNEKFARVENVRKFRMIPKELDHEDGELTATQKLKRSAMDDMFGDLIESMYS